MTPQQVAGLAARLFSILAGITACQTVGIAQALKGAASPGPARVPHVPAETYLLGSLALWFFPSAIAHKLVSRTRFEDKLYPLAGKVVVVSCVALGLMVIALGALPPLSAYFSHAAFWIGSGPILSTLEVSRHVDGLGRFIQLVVGAILVAKAHTIGGRSTTFAQVQERKDNAK